MIRRRTVVLTSAGILLGIMVLFFITIAVLTRTSFGRERIRAFAYARVKSAVHGKLYLGRLGGSILSDITTDSLELRDEYDSLFVAAGRTSVRFDPRDLFDMRIVLRDLRMERAVARVDFDSAGTVNFRKIFPLGKPGPPRTTRAWGDYIELRDAEINNLALQVTMPWSPDTSLRGARRDSAIAYALSRKDKDIKRVGGHFVQTLRWFEGHLELANARLDDRMAGGRFLNVKKLDLKGFDPPLDFRNVRGTMRLQGDSVFLEVPHFDLPASVGSAKGRVWWGSGLPTRYDISIVGDSVSLADVAWVYPTLPRTGGGKLNLLIRSEPDPRLVDYVLTDMDVHSTDSWLRGRMTFGIGAPITILKDVDLVAQPVDFRLIETLSGEPLPYPFRGTLTGTVKARGGPLNRFFVDAADIVYRDANVPGAMTVGRGSGELDIVQPSNTAFHGFDLQLDQLDLRTVQYLNPSFPRLNGLVAGRTTLDSTLLDVRFRNADLTHSDGTGPVTHVTGAGRVTFGEYTTYDVALTALPISFTTLHRAYTEGRIPLHGEYVGPMRLQGTLQDLEVSTELRGPSGMIAYEGRVDADSVGGYGAHGNARFGSLNLRTFLDTAITPTTDLTGAAELDIAGDSLATLVGSVTLELERSLLDSVRVYTSRTRLRFADRRMFVDTLGIESVLGSLTVKNGALGLAPNVRDSLSFGIAADSLGGLRRFLVRPATAAVTDDEAPVVDSLKATIRGGGWLSGSIDTLDVRADIDASAVDALGTQADSAGVKATFADVTHAPRGEANGKLVNATVSGVRLSRADGTLKLADARSGEFQVLATATNGPVIETAGSLGFIGDTTTAQLKKLGISLHEHRFDLQRESTIRVEPSRIVVDTIRLVGPNGEQMAFAADLPSDGPIRGAARVDSVHMADLGDLAQLRVPLGGWLSGRIDVRGTRQAPEADVKAEVRGGKVGEVNLASITLDGHYANLRMIAVLDVKQQDTTVISVSANYPIDLSFASRDNRLPNDTMRVMVRSRDVDMRLIESFTPKVVRAGGRFSANMDVVGNKKSQTLVGDLRIAGGVATLPDAGITLRDINTDIVARNDSVLISRFSMVSGPQADNTLSIRGHILHPLGGSTNPPVFHDTLSARQFHIIGSPRVADLYISTSEPLILHGSQQGSTLTGAVLVNSGRIFMPEPTDKQLITLESSDLEGLDTATVRKLGLVPAVPSAFVQNLVVQNVTITMGPDVWVRSAETRDINIKLGGSIQVRVSYLNTKPKLGLEGTLQTERGRYLLNLATIVQRTFDIESGTLSFYGITEFNPAVNLSALYTHRQVSATYGGRNDVHIRVRVTGTLWQPKLRLESGDELNISESDLISYLVWGAPSFDVSGASRQNYSQLSAIGLNTLSSYLGSLLSGGIFDYVEVQTAADKLRLGTQQRELFAGTQLGLGKQLNARTFVSLSAGVCQFFSRAQSIDPASFTQSIGIKAEYQIKQDFGVSASVEPSLSAVLCSQGGARGFATTARQFGSDFFRTFRW